MTEPLKNIKLEVNNSIGTVILDNPPENYLTGPEFISVDVLRNWKEKEELKGLIITGTGRHFSGGANLDGLFSMALDHEEMFRMMSRGKELLDYLENIDIPVFAVIKGICFGAGLEIALACHIRICSHNALFAFPESNWGLIPGLGGTVRIMERTSLLNSMKMVMEGDMIDAKEALEMKIIDHIVASDGLMEYSTSLLNKMTDGKLHKVIHCVMQAFSNARKISFSESMKEETRMFCELASIEAKSRGVH